MTSVPAVTPASVMMSAASAFSVVITSTALAITSSRSGTFLDRGRDHTRSDRLGENEYVPGLGRGVRHHARRIHLSDRDQTILRFRVVDAVTPERGQAHSPRDVRSAAHDLVQDPLREKRSGKAHEIEDKERPGPHRIDVGEGIGRGDPAEVVRIVDDGREEIGGHDQRTIIGETVYRSVVSGDVADQDIRIFDGEHVTQNLRQLGHAEFTRSTGAMTELGQPDLWPLVPWLFCHVVSSLGVSARIEA